MSHRVPSKQMHRTRTWNQTWHAEYLLNGTAAPQFGCSKASCDKCPYLSDPQEPSWRLPFCLRESLPSESNQTNSSARLQKSADALQLRITTVTSSSTDCLNQLVTHSVLGSLSASSPVSGHSPLKTYKMWYFGRWIWRSRGIPKHMHAVSISTPCQITEEYSTSTKKVKHLHPSRNPSSSNTVWVMAPQDLSLQPCIHVHNAPHILRPSKT